jgi:hypothetical protein
MEYLSITWQSVEAIGLDCFQERDEKKGVIWSVYDNLNAEMRYVEWDE